jgi:hypothetical protein
MIADVPVFEMLPPRSPNELAETGILKITGPPIAGVTAAAVIASQTSPSRIFSLFAARVFHAALWPISRFGHRCR